MAIESGSHGKVEQGATVVITHRVREGQHAGYEAWLQEVGPACKAAVGHIDLQIIRPIAGVTSTYTIVIRFDSHDHLAGWMHSQQRKALIEKAAPLLANKDDFFIRSGLDFWFTPEGAKAKVPVRWKQFLVTWSAIFPLVLVVPLAVVPALRGVGVPANRYVDTFVITGVIVSLIIYVVMPRYTKLVQRWLFS